MVLFVGNKVIISFMSFISSTVPSSSDGPHSDRSDGGVDMMQSDPRVIGISGLAGFILGIIVCLVVVMVVFCILLHRHRAKNNR